MDVKFYGQVFHLKENSTHVNKDLDGSSVFDLSDKSKYQGPLSYDDICLSEFQH